MKWFLHLAATPSHISTVILRSYSHHPRSCCKCSNILQRGGRLCLVLKIRAAQQFSGEDFFFVCLNKDVLTSAISCRRHSPLVILAKKAEEKKSFFFLYLLEQFLKTNQLQNLSPNCAHLKILLAISPSSKLFCDMSIYAAPEVYCRDLSLIWQPLLHSAHLLGIHPRANSCPAVTR